MKKEVKEFFRMLKKNKQGIVGLVMIICIVLLGIFASVISPFDPEMTNAADARMAPCLAHLFGTDETGMDIFSRCIWAIRIDVVIGVFGTLISLMIGIPFGLFVGYYEGIIGEVILRIADLIQAFPAFILAMALVSALGNSTQNILMVVAFVNVPIYTRFVRGEVLAMKSRPFIEAGHTAGMSPTRIMFQELLPNSLRPALVQASINIGGAILLTAGLSYIGAGVTIPTPEWGSMISIGAPLILTKQWWAALFPGLSIGVTVFGFAMFADFLRIYLNPERR